MLEKAKSQSIKTGRSGHTRNIGHKTKNGDKKKTTKYKSSTYRNSIHL